MSHPARVYRIALVTPSDVDEARAIVDTAIQEWNHRNFQDRQVILMPHAWAPAGVGSKGEGSGISTDLLIGVFWTRLGSTGGSYQELFDDTERLERAGVPVLLFFSRQKTSLDDIDAVELTQLKEFKRQQAGKARVEDFSDVIQFREKLVRHIDQQIRILLSTEGLVGDRLNRKPVDLSVGFADAPAGGDPSHLLLESKYFEIRNFEKIPDYARPDGTGEAPPSLWGVVYNQINKNYYRDYIKYVFQGSILRPVRFNLTNTGLIGLRDVRAEFSVIPNEGGVFCLKPEERLTRPDKETPASGGKQGGPGIGFAVDNFETFVEVACIQPQRQVSSLPLFLLGSDRSISCSVAVTLYADALTEPIRQTLTVDLSVTRENVDAMEFFDVLRER